MKKRYKIPLLLSLVIILFFLVATFLLTETKLLEFQVNRSLKLFVQKDYPIKINIEEINGSFLHDLILQNVSVDYTEKGKEYTILKVKNIFAHYNILNLWRRKWVLEKVEIDSPLVEIRQDETGRFLLPRFKKQKTISKTGIFDFKIANLSVKDASLKMVSPNRKKSLENFNLVSNIVKDRKGTEIKITNLQFIYPEKNFSLKQLSGKSLVEKDSIFIDSLNLITGESRIFSSGVIDTKKKQFFFQLKGDSVSMDEVGRISGVGLVGKLKTAGTWEGNLKNFGGEVLVSGEFFKRDFDNVKLRYGFENAKLRFTSILGKIFKADFSGRGEINFKTHPEEYSYDGVVSHLDITNIVETELHSDFSGKVLLKGNSFSEKFQLNLNLDLDTSKIDTYTFHQTKGDIVVTADSIHFTDNFNLRYKNTFIKSSGNLAYSGNLNLKSEVEFKDLTDFNNQIFIKEMRGTGKALISVFGKTDDFDAEGKFFSDSAWAYEFFSKNLLIDFKVRNFITQRKGEFNIFAQKGEAWGIPFDTVSSVINLDSAYVVIDTTKLKSPTLNLLFWGNLDTKPMPQPLYFEKVICEYQGKRFENQKPVEISIREENVLFQPAFFKTNGGEIVFDGTMDYENNFDFKVKIDDFDLSQWSEFIFPQKNMAGKLFCDAKVKGNFENPEILFTGKIKEAKFSETNLGEITADLSYKQKKLNINSVLVEDPYGTYSFSGWAPLDLSFVPKEKRVLDQEQFINADINSQRFELLKLIIPDIEYLEGVSTGKFTVTGTPLHPLINGDLQMEKGTLKFKQLFDPFENLKAKIHFADNNLIIEDITGFMQHRSIIEKSFWEKIKRFFSPKKIPVGEIYGFGNINLKDINAIEYDLAFSGRNILLNYEYADVSATADFNIEILGKDIATISGDVLVTQLNYREPFTTASPSGTVAPDSTLWNLNLNVSAENNLWVLNNDMNAELKGEVRVLRNDGTYNLLGQADVIRGKYFLYGNSFQIDKGIFTFDNVAEINPKLDILVSTTLFANSPSSGTQIKTSESANEVSLAIGGTLLSPEVKPAPGSPYSGEDVLELLTFHRSFASVDSLGVGSLFQDRVVRSLGGAYGSRLLENWATRRLGVETIEIRPTTMGKFSLWDTEITVGKYLSNKLYLSYTRTLSQTSGQEAGLEYRISKHFYLEGHRDKLGLFHLALSLNWEY
jgi:autotransporter translocation and assembly factor TamB